MVLDATLLNTQHYKVRIKGKVENGVAPSLHLSVATIERGAFGSPFTNVTNLSVERSPHDLEAYMLDCNIVLSEFNFLCYYIQF